MGWIDKMPVLEIERSQFGTPEEQQKIMEKCKLREVVQRKGSSTADSADIWKVRVSVFTTLGSYLRTGKADRKALNFLVSE